MTDHDLRIAISTSISDLGEYGAAIARFDARPVGLRFDPAAVDAQLDGIDGVVISGGGDVDPALYGGDPAHVEGVDRTRDEFEGALLIEARRRGLATLCICRGMQIANVAFGGTLVEDIGNALGPQAAEMHQRRDAAEKVIRSVLPGHRVSVDPGSLLAGITGAGSILTGSRHHQSLAEVAPDLRVTGRCADGTVEAVEARFDSPFWLGVQWHPESTFDDAGESDAIFRAFLRAARVARSGRFEPRAGTSAF